jgi:hypothetical protein
MKRSLFCLTAHDYECIDHVKATHSHIRRADAVRFAILQQQGRSGETGAVRGSKGLAEECREINAVNPDGKPLKRWHMLLSEPLDRILDSLMERHGFRHKAEAVRFIVRSQAYEDGFKPGGVVIAAPRKKRPRKKPVKEPAEEAATG